MRSGSWPDCHGGRCRKAAPGPRRGGGARRRTRGGLGRRTRVRRARCDLPLRGPSYPSHASRSGLLARAARLRAFRALGKPSRIARTGEALTFVAALGECAGLRHLRVEYAVLPPGHRSSSPHAHTTREELVYEGTPDIWLDGHLHPLRPGDTIALAAGTGIAHT